MALTSVPATPLRTMSQADFDAAMALVMAWLPTNVSEMNILQASLTAIAAGGAFSIPYTFDSTTTDADPGAGKLRLSSATQNASTVIRADLLGADGATWTSVIDTFDDSTNTITGQIKLVKLTDATKWLAFNITALASPSGYKNITVANVASSSNNPFTNGDSLILQFTRAGDKGATGPVYNLPYLNVREQQANNTYGGTNVAADITQTRVLNTTVVNTMGASLASNTITLLAGTYQIRARVPAYNVGDHKAFLYNSSDATYTIIGSSTTMAANQTDSIISGQFTIASTKNFTIRNWTSVVQANAGLGYRVNSGQVEVYTEVEIWKVA